MAFIPENYFEQILIAAANDAGKRPDFYRAFLEEDIFVLGKTQTQSPSGWHTFKAGEKLAVHVIKSSKGTDVIPVFSSLTRVKIFLGNHQATYVKLKGKDLLNTVGSATEIILNPGSEQGKLFLPHELAGLIDGSIFKPLTQTVQQPTQYMVGAPKVYPTKFADALISLFRSRPQVKRAYLAQIFVPNSGDPPHPLVAIDAEGNFEELAAECGLVARDTLERGLFADFVRFSTNGSFSYFAETEPFYTRGQ